MNKQAEALRYEIAKITANQGMPCGMGMPMQDGFIDEITNTILDAAVEAINEAARNYDGDMFPSLSIDAIQKLKGES